MKPKVKVHPKYTYTKEGVYYFCRVIPKDLEPYYSRLGLLSRYGLNLLLAHHLLRNI